MVLLMLSLWPLLYPETCELVVYFVCVVYWYLDIQICQITVVKMSLPLLNEKRERLGACIKCFNPFTAYLYIDLNVLCMQDVFILLVFALCLFIESWCVCGLVWFF